MQRAGVLGLALLTLGCGAGGEGVGAPSALVAPPEPPESYQVRRWTARAPMKHCFGPGIDLGLALETAEDLKRASGIAYEVRAWGDPGCSVTWEIGQLPPDLAASTGLNVDVDQANVVSFAQVKLSWNSRGVFEHEGGHVLGLGHSVNRDDVMCPETRVEKFSAGEREELARRYSQR